MIDSFWTKRRVKQMSRKGDLLVGRWLEDYVGWIYGRAWYGCQGDKAEAQRISDETFLSAAGRLNEWIKGRRSMSEWLLSVFQSLAGDVSNRGTEPQTTAEIRKAIQGISAQPLSEAESFWPELIRLSQRALAMLFRDEQEILVCRYLRLDNPADIAAKYDLALSEVQTLLTRSGHSFRRTLESLSQVGTEETSRSGQADPAMLEMNLERIFRSLGSKPAWNPEDLKRLKEQVLAVLAQNKPVGWNNIAKKGVLIGCGVVVFCGLTAFFALRGRNTPPGGQQKMGKPENNSRTGQGNASSNSAEDIQQVFEMGVNRDVEGLLGILRTGSYPSQIVAAHYLGQFGDKTAIDLLDRAAQKWYAESPIEKNPFVEAIRAIEDRTREQLQEQLRKASILDKLKTVSEKLHAAPKFKTSAVESNMPPKEPNYKRPILPVRAEPSLLLVIAEPNRLPVITEPNLLLVVVEPNQLPVITEPNL
jgi:DNA-directed RNA polymerase specialized sigma24 family protein